MANKPQDPASEDKRKASENAPVDYVRTKQEVDAAAEKRQAEAELSKAGRGESEVSPVIKDHLKQDQEDEMESLQNSSDEPIVEDEP